MKQKLIFIIALAAGFLLAAQPALAAPLVICGRKGQAACTFNDMFAMGATVVSFLLGASSLIAILFIVIGGIRMIFSGGSSQQIQSGKQTLFNAILGLVIVLCSYLIINVVLDKLSGGAITLDNPTSFFKQ